MRSQAGLGDGGISVMTPFSRPRIWWIRNSPSTRRLACADRRVFDLAPSSVLGSWSPFSVHGSLSFVFSLWRALRTCSVD